jgi:chromosomal replication initiator protein
MHKKCQEMEALIPTDVLEFIAYNARASIRELEGILVQAIAQAKLENSTPTVNSVAKIMKKLGMVEVNKPSAAIERDSRPLVTNCNDVINIVSGYYKVEMTELTGDRRSRDIMVPRQVCMYLLRNEFNFSFEKIGDEFGGRNHTTAMHAYNKMVKALKNDSKLVRDVNAIKKEMGM